MYLSTQETYSPNGAIPNGKKRQSGVIQAPRCICTSEFEFNMGLYVPNDERARNNF
jgi:hypothetical protein